MTGSTQQEVPHETLKQWLALVANDRDQRAFKKLFDHYVPLLRAYSLVRDPGANSLADELAQEVMIKVWHKAFAYNAALANTNTWIFTLARNCRIDYFRRNGRYFTNLEASDVFEKIPDSAVNPFQAAQQHSAQQNMVKSLAQLPTEQAQVLEKVYLQGCSHQQTSEALRLPLGTVKSRVRLALKKMQLLIGGQ